jgi:tetratricopeptide (TPR) repeat protein
MADLGIVGLVVTILLFLAWTAAALSATDLLPRRWVRPTGEDAPLPRRDWTGDRTALVALATVPLVFGVQSLLDWTWFIPAPMAMALVAAGFVCGRGPLSDGDTIEPIRRRPAAGRIVCAVAALATAALLAWAIWQPEASARATDEALALADEGRFEEARAKTDDAEDLNPLSPSPLLVRAAVDTQAGRTEQARSILERAVLRFPGDPETWQRLAAFELGTLDAPEQALETVKGALHLDPHGARPRQIFLNARARLREKTGSAQPAVGG